MQRIQIKNFMAITQADIEIRKTLIIVGEQASGKSTIAKLIYYFQSLREDYFSIISQNFDTLQSPDTLQKKLWMEISRKFYRLFGSIQYLPSFNIQYWYSADKSITLTDIPRDGGGKNLKIEIGPLMPSVFYTQLTSDVMPLLTRLKEAYGRRSIYENNAYGQLLMELNQYVNRTFESSHQLVFLPAGRNVTVTYADFFRQNFYGTLQSDLARIQDEDPTKKAPRFVRDTYIMIQFLQRVQTIMDTFKGETFQTIMEDAVRERPKLQELPLEIFLEKVSAILKGKYKYDKNLGEIILFTNKDYVFLNNASSGQQEVIRVLQDIFLNVIQDESTSRIIEEPEAHLFPMAQKYLLETIAFMIGKTDSQIIITTHSPYVLSIVNNLLFAYRLVDHAQNFSDFHLDPTETEVYSMTEGKSVSIMDHQTGLVDQNALDTISEELADEFDRMCELLSQRGKSLSL